MVPQASSVLVVDDEAPDSRIPHRSSLRCRLRRPHGRTRPGQALASVDSNPPDLVLSDIYMPSSTADPCRRDPAPFSRYRNRAHERLPSRISRRSHPLHPQALRPRRPPQNRRRRRRCRIKKAPFAPDAAQRGRYRMGSAERTAMKDTRRDASGMMGVLVRPLRRRCPVRVPRECPKSRKRSPPICPRLRPAQRRGPALWVYGAVMAGSACQAAVIAALLPLGRTGHALRQRLREWLYDGADKAAPCAVELDVAACFAPLLRWVLAWWRGDGLPLAIDATALGDRWSSLTSACSTGAAPSRSPGTSCRQPARAPGCRRSCRCCGRLAPRCRRR